MKLESLDGQFVDLTVTSYQFGGGRSVGDQRDWDANWLMVHGKVWDGDRSWEFSDPCMTTWEARELAGWLRGLTNASPETVESAEPDELRLWLTEPNLTFELAGTTEGLISLIVHFDAESRPPSGSSDDGQGLGHRVALSVPDAVLMRAVDDWDQDLTQFPER